MKTIKTTGVQGFLRQESGQVLPMLAVIVVLLMGMAGISIDAGRIYYGSRQLQASTDSAALAGAQAITATNSTNSSVAAAVNLYSAASGGDNVSASLPGTTVSYVGECLSSLTAMGSGCVGTEPYNAIQVTQKSSMPMYFASLFGFKTFNMTTVSTAATRGSNARPANVAIIVDTTLSMNETDNNCGATQMTCALNGVQVLLKTLSPCSPNIGTCTVSNGVAASSYDRVAIFTFPAMVAGTQSVNTNCTTAIPAPSKTNGYYNDSTLGNYTMYTPNKSNGYTGTSVTPWSGVAQDTPYTFPTAGATTYSPSAGTYQVTNYLSDYRASSTATTLNSSSDLVQAAGGASGCGSMLPPNFDGQYGTYYAGVIYAAQASLVAQQKANPGAENIMILLSDGDANSPQTGNGGYSSMSSSPASSSGSYPSWVDECGQGITAAKAATAAGTTVYTVAYGSPISGGCTTDTSGTYKAIQPCTAMGDMASSTATFYSDYVQNNKNSGCVASNPATSLNQIFTSIAGSLTVSRLIPNNTQ